jgi:hypothetical protein
MPQLKNKVKELKKISWSEMKKLGPELEIIKV